LSILTPAESAITIGRFELKFCTSAASSISVRLLISPGSRPASKVRARTVVVAVMLKAEE